MCVEKKKQNVFKKLEAIWNDWNVHFLARKSLQWLQKFSLGLGHWAEAGVEGEEDGAGEGGVSAIGGCCFHASVAPAVVCYLC